MNCLGAIFDMDGILFDTERIYQGHWHDVAKERGIQLGENFTRDITGTSGDRIRQVICRYYQVEDSTEIHSECRRRMKESLEEHVPVKQGVPEILEYFKSKGVKMAVASSSRRFQIESNLERTGLRRYFQAVVSGAELQNGKPAPDIFLKAAEEIGLKPEQCYVFEDSANGIRAGHAAGCVTIMIPDLIEPTEEIAALCSGVYKDFETFLKGIK